LRTCGSHRDGELVVDHSTLAADPFAKARAVQQVEVIVHCAANTGFHVPLDEILATNTVGFMELLKIAAGCKRLKVSLGCGPSPGVHLATELFMAVTA
jgi:nucleoside-diphosphate-sugar epimerase